VDYVVKAPTVAAGSLLGASRVVQVHPRGVRLLAGASTASDAALPSLLPAPDDVDEDLRVAAAAVLDPYVLLRLSDGSALLHSADAATGEGLQHCAHWHGARRDGDSFSLRALARSSERR
jgi:cleavage and polyadenylation specificity factor subunit 1